MCQDVLPRGRAAEVTFKECLPLSPAFSKEAALKCQELRNASQPEASRHICDKKFGMSFTSVRCLGESNMGIVFLVLFWYPVHEPAALEKLLLSFG